MEHSSDSGIEKGCGGIAEEVTKSVKKPMIHIFKMGCGGSKSVQAQAIQKAPTDALVTNEEPSNSQQDFIFNWGRSGEVATKSVKFKVVYD